MGLARRLAVLTAVLAVALVLGATEIALRWSERSRMDDRERATVALAETWASYLGRIAPTGDPAALDGQLTTWPSQHLTATGAAIFTGTPRRLTLVSSTDTTALSQPGPGDSVALARRRPYSWLSTTPSAWHVAMPVGTPRPYGVLEVWVSNTPLDQWARTERRRSYLLALGAALLVATGVGLLTSRWVGRPLHALGDAMALAHGGAAGAPAAPELGPAEFRMLARRYNSLRDALEIRERESAARAALLALEERARGFERLTLLDETAAGFAHEIGTPLNTVSGHLQLLRDDLSSAPQAARDRIQLLLGQVDRLAAIVRARLERGGWPPAASAEVDLRQLAQQMLRFLEPSLGAAGIAAELPGEGRTMAWCDPALVEQILLNLLKNAIDAMSPGGRVTITVGTSADGAWLEVADTGPGIAPEARRQLFNPFVTTKASGTGLGLAVSRRLARAMGGELVHVPTERGTTWRLTLPVDRPAGAGPGGGPQEGGAAATRISAETT
ncbi:MAG: sensor histidine kinase [Gemmatimonadota bacterium]